MPIAGEMLLRAIALALASLATAAGAASAATVTLAASGSWQAPSSWDTGVVPTADDDVVVPSGRDLTLAEDAVAHSLTIAAVGTSVDLGGHALSAGEGSSRFAALDLRGGGRLDVGGPLAITGSLSVASATTLGTAGATTWSAGSVTLGGIWENTGALAITGGTLSTAVQPGGGLANLAGGTIERHTGTGVVSITVPFTDLATASPSITVRSGTLALTGGTPGGLASHVRLEAGGTLRVTGSQAPTLLGGAAHRRPGHARAGRRRHAGHPRRGDPRRPAPSPSPVARSTSPPAPRPTASRAPRAPAAGPARWSWGPARPTRPT